MLRVFFNPYPGKAADYEAGKRSLLATVNAYWKLFKNKQVKANNPDGNDCIRSFLLAEDKQGAWYYPFDLLKPRQYSGRERDLIKLFLVMIDKGSRVKIDDLSICKNWELCDLNFAAPILEYALRQDGMAITISDDNDWKTDFFHLSTSQMSCPIFMAKMITLLYKIGYKNGMIETYHFNLH